MRFTQFLACFIIAVFSESLIRFKNRGQQLVALDAAIIELLKAGIEMR